MKTQFVSRWDMKKLIRNDMVSNTAIISINDTPTEMSEMIDLLEDCGATYLALTFSDVELGERGCITESQARQIYEFVNLHHNKNIIAHCFMGVSRSGAIAAWINEYLDRGDWYLEDYKGYNPTVYDMLKTVDGTSLRAYHESLEMNDRKYGWEE